MFIYFLRIKGTGKAVVFKDGKKYSATWKNQPEHQGLFLQIQAEQK